jgi:heme/copper-type cytochrome/quinol oxidase subunit 2
MLISRCLLIQLFCMNLIRLLSILTALLSVALLLFLIFANIQTVPVEWVAYPPNSMVERRLIDGDIYAILLLFIVFIFVFSISVSFYFRKIKKETSK